MTDPVFSEETTLAADEAATIARTVRQLEAERDQAREEVTRLREAGDAMAVAAEHVRDVLIGDKRNRLPVSEWCDMARPRVTALLAAADAWSALRP